MLKRILVAAAVVLATTTPAQADVHACVFFGTATFDPSLTTELRSGTITLEYDHTCAAVHDSVVGTGLVRDTNRYVLDYTGSCLTAALSWNGATGVLAGGLVAAHVSLNTSNGPRAYVFLPHSLDPCDMTTATFVAVAQYGSLNP
jgi:hypothetical protein